MNNTRGTNVLVDFFGVIAVVSLSFLSVWSWWFIL